MKSMPLSIPYFQRSLISGLGTEAKHPLLRFPTARFDQVRPLVTYLIDKTPYRCSLPVLWLAASMDPCFPTR